jgi:hypothetical protein
MNEDHVATSRPPWEAGRLADEAADAGLGDDHRMISPEDIVLNCGNGSAAPAVEVVPQAVQCARR